MSRVSIVETHLIFKSPLRPRQRTDYFVVHHIGKIPASLTAAQIGAVMINRWHQEDRGWSGIGYHYVIRPDGSVERGRPRTYMGAHDEGENACSIGICVVGDFTASASRPTAAQQEALAGLLADLCEIYSLAPKDEGVIVGHRDNEPPETPTECPGDGLYGLLPAIRAKVAALCR